MENNRQFLSCNRRTRAFRANFEKLIAIVHFNRIHIMTAGEFRIIDVCSHVCLIISSDSGRTRQIDKVYRCFIGIKSGSKFLRRSTTGACSY